ncbi:MAG TPA: NUDIX domain-containing protein [Rubrobacteraceae bacterium]|nr:NUDIX domain-containing protein [Rubrobacteraceae bacterium]
MSFRPADPYRYCPVDATPLDRLEQPNGARCPTCGRSWYRSSSPSTGCAIVEDGRVLVTVRAGEPEKGRVDVPGGFLEPGEHPVDALVREIREELGVEIDDIVGPLIMATHTYGEGGPFVLALGFAARLVEGDPEPADDVAELRWVGVDELDDLDFAWPHDRELVEIALELEGDGAWRV